MQRGGCFIFLIIFFIVKLNVSFAQHKSTSILEEGYYVVVGAYSPNQEHYAVKFLDYLDQQGIDASYGYSPFKNLLFTYVHYDQDFRSSLDVMRDMRKKENFDDTWVYVMGDYETPKVPFEKEKINIYGINNPDLPPSEDSAAVVVENPVIAAPKKDAMQLLEEKVIYKEKAEAKEKEEITLEDFLSFMNLYNAANRNDVSGEIQIIDPVRASLLEVVESGSYVNLPDPNNRSGDLLLIADVFGYRKAQKKINYYEPLAVADGEDIQILADIFVVNFELVRYHVGDIATMFNVYFFKDAAIMQPDSKYELKQLLEMMEENPHYRIRIHGHTNGKNPGPIIYHGEDDNLFALTEDDKKGFGSAKRLSKERAMVIKEYLVKNGIAPERMEVKAWGGRRMLYDKHSSQAKKNVRVEIEIIDE